jgi:ABC-type Fe3+-hydroxamate transport system substrate-binding protein
MADVNKNVNIKVNWHDQKATKGTAKLKTGIDKVGKATKKADKESKGFFKNMSSGMKLVAAYITGKVVMGVVNLGKKLVTAAGKYEQLNIAFETFIGDADKAKQVIEELNRFAALTPFRTDQVNNAAKSLLAFGFTGKELIPTLKMLGDISAGTGKDLKELGIIFGQIRGAGRLLRPR